MSYTWSFEMFIAHESGSDRGLDDGAAFVDRLCKMRSSERHNREREAQGSARRLFHGPTLLWLLMRRWGE
jgi:hypothetical protein